LDNYLNIVLINLFKDFVLIKESKGLFNNAHETYHLLPANNYCLTPHLTKYNKTHICFSWKSNSNPASSQPKLIFDAYRI